MANSTEFKTFSVDPAECSIGQHPDPSTGLLVQGWHPNLEIYMTSPGMMSSGPIEDHSVGVMAQVVEFESEWVEDVIR
jgi:hypothetical protein